MKKLAYILAATFQAPKTASAFEPIISVDQEINQVTFSVDSKAVIPVWIFQDKDGEFTERKAQNGLRRIFATAGDYTVRMQVMNASGVTPDYVEKTFHIDNTIASFDKFITFLAGGTAADNTKDWHVDGETAGHMGCGPAGTDGLEWWSAAANDKAAFGVYEDVVTFGGDGAYAYDPGEDGGVYVNKDITVSPFVEQKGDATEDFVALVDPQTATYSFEYQGNDLYLVLPEKTLFPYIDNDAFWANPEFKPPSRPPTYSKASSTMPIPTFGNRPTVPTPSVSIMLPAGPRLPIRKWSWKAPNTPLTCRPLPLTSGRPSSTSSPKSPSCSPRTRTTTSLSSSIPTRPFRA